MTDGCQSVVVITWSGRLGLSWGDLDCEVEWVMVSIDPI